MSTNIDAALPIEANPAPIVVEDTYFSKWDAEITERAVFFTINAKNAQIKMPYHKDFLLNHASLGSPIRTLEADMKPGCVIDIGKLGIKVADLDPAVVDSVLKKFGEAMYANKPIIYENMEEFRTASDIISATGMTVGKPELTKWMDTWLSRKASCQIYTIDSATLRRMREENVETLAWIDDGRTNEYHEAAEKITLALVSILSRERIPYTQAIEAFATLPSDRRDIILARALCSTQTIHDTKANGHAAERALLVAHNKRKVARVLEMLKPCRKVPRTLLSRVEQVLNE